MIGEQAEDQTYLAHKSQSIVLIDPMRLDSSERPEVAS